MLSSSRPLLTASRPYCQGDSLLVFGKVICDPCRVSFETTVSYPLAGSLVQLECTNRTNGVHKHAFEAKTDTNGVYQLTVDGPQVPEAINKARISLTKNNGVSESTRNANALFYAPEKSLKSCLKILLDMVISPPGNDFYF